MFKIFLQCVFVITVNSSTCNLVCFVDSSVRERLAAMGPGAEELLLSMVDFDPTRRYSTLTLMQCKRPFLQLSSLSTFSILC